SLGSYDDHNAKPSAARQNMRPTNKTDARFTPVNGFGDFFMVTSIAQTLPTNKMNSLGWDCGGIARHLYNGEAPTQLCQIFTLLVHDLKIIRGWVPPAVVYKIKSN